MELYVFLQLMHAMLIVYRLPDNDCIDRDLVFADKAILSLSFLICYNLTFCSGLMLSAWFFMDSMWYTFSR